MKLVSGVTLPATMKALALATGAVELVERPVPRPRAGEVLIAMRAAPINPNDLMSIDERYEVKRARGSIAGFEGAGRVVGSGGGLAAGWMLGRTVACNVAGEDGTWAEYVVAPAMRCVPLDSGVDVEQGAMLLTNPMTAQVLLETALASGHRAFVQNAAAGALGKMLVRSCLRRGLSLVNVVRRTEQAKELEALGAKQVIVSSEPDAEATLAGVCRSLGVRFAFDAVGGEATRQLARALGDGGEVLVYGMLSGQPLQLDAGDVVFRGISVRGFTMYEWVKRTSLLGQFLMVRAAQQRLGDDLQSTVRARLPLSAHLEALTLARGTATDGKVLFAIA